MNLKKGLVMFEAVGITGAIITCEDPENASAVVDIG
jgi:hypothetical protein